MRDLKFITHAVRKATDNKDLNGVENAEIDRYVADAVRAIQSLIFSNNPLCSYFQSYEDYEPASTRIYTLPADCFGDNAVSRVQVLGEDNCWVNLDRVWPEENILGWYTANNTLIITGDENESYPETIRVHYFRRVPRPSRSIGQLTAVTSSTQLSISPVPTAQEAEELSLTDRYMCLVMEDGTISQENIAVQYILSQTPAIFTFTTVPYLPSRYLVMGKHASTKIDLPDECESYLMSFVQRRIMARNNYTAEAQKMNDFTAEEKQDLINIFADAAQSTVRPPITDTSFLGV